MKNYKVTIKEVGKANPLTTFFYGASGRQQVVEHFGLNEPDVEWYKIEEV